MVEDRKENKNEKQIIYDELYKNALNILCSNGHAPDEAADRLEKIPNLIPVINAKSELRGDMELFLELIKDKTNEELASKLSFLERFSGYKWGQWWEVISDKVTWTQYIFREGKIFDGTFLPKKKALLPKEKALKILQDNRYSIEKAERMLELKPVLIPLINSIVSESSSTYIDYIGEYFLRGLVTLENLELVERMLKFYAQLQNSDRGVFFDSWSFLKEGVGDEKALQMLEERPNFIQFVTIAEIFGFNLQQLLMSVKDRNNEEFAAMSSYLNGFAHKEWSDPVLGLTQDPKKFISKEFFELLISLECILEPKIKQLLDSLPEPKVKWPFDSLPAEEKIYVAVLKTIKNVKEEAGLTGKAEEKIGLSQKDVEASGHVRTVGFLKRPSFPFMWSSATSVEYSEIQRAIEEGQEQAASNTL